MRQLTRFRMTAIAGLAGLALAIPATLIPASPAAATGDSITSFTAGVGPSLIVGWAAEEVSYIGIAKADSFTASDPCDNDEWYDAAEVPENKVGYFYFDGSANPREFYSYFDWNNTGWFSVEPSTEYVACLVNNEFDTGRGSPFTVTTGTGEAPGALPAPTISGVSPSTGSTAGNTTITITGTNFTPGGSSEVTVGGVAATNVTVVTPTSIEATTPAGTAGTADVVVTNSDGQFDTNTGGFTYIAPAPTISGISPSTGSANGGTEITITGTGFTSDGSFGVTVGGEAATGATVVSSTSISATTPAGTVGAADVVVTNSDGQIVTRDDGFTYLAPAPTISGVSPSRGSTAGGRLITITGTGFTSGGAFGVTVDGSACASSSWVSATAVTCTTPAHSAGTVNVVVTNSDGQTANSTEGFTYLAPSSSLFTNYTAADGLGSNTVNGVYVTGSTIYAATASGLSISTDGGANFTNKTTSSGLGDNFVKGVYAIDGTPDTIYAATDGGGLSISTDGGATFTNSTVAKNGLGSDFVNGVYVDGSTIYAATAPVSAVGGLSISTDGGANFTNKTTSSGLGSNEVRGVYVVGSTIYAATNGGLSISTDGGANFTNKTTSSGLGSRYVQGVYAIDGALDTVYAATTFGLAISTDGGANFTNKTSSNGLGSNVVRGVYVSGGTIYAATDGGLSISTDGGTSFSTYTTADGLGNNGVNGVYVSGDTIYAATSGGLSIEAAASAPTSPGISPSPDSAAGGTSTPTPSASASATPTAVPTPTSTASASPSASPAVKVPAGFLPLSAAEKASAQTPVVNAPLSTSVSSAPVLTVPAGTAVAPVVSGVPVNTSLRAGVKAPTRAKEAFVTFGTTRSNANGRAKVPAFKPSRAGTYTIQLATANGKAFYLKVTVTAKAKPVKQPTAKPAVAGKARE